VKALELDRGSASAFDCLGVIAIKRSNLLEAERFLSRAVELDGSDCESRLYLGAVHRQMGRYAEAEKWLVKAREVGGNDVNVRFELGRLYLLTEREKEALCIFREALGIEHNNPASYWLLASALMQQKSHAEAELVLRRGLHELDLELRWPLYLTLARLLVEIGDNNTDASL
jgi:Flp pilus assembly protein TadD